MNPTLKASNHLESKQPHTVPYFHKSRWPNYMRLFVSRKVSDLELDMEALLITFEQELAARERAKPTKSNTFKTITSDSLYASLRY